MTQIRGVTDHPRSARTTPGPASSAEHLALRNTAERCYEGEGPDPRFVIAAPLTTRRTLLSPGGLLRAEAAARTAVLADRQGPLMDQGPGSSRSICRATA